MSEIESSCKEESDDDVEWKRSVYISVISCSGCQLNFLRHNLKTYIYTVIPAIIMILIGMMKRKKKDHRQMTQK